MMGDYIILKKKKPNEDGTHEYEQIKIPNRQNKFLTEADARDWIANYGESGEGYIVGKVNLKDE